MEGYGIEAEAHERVCSDAFLAEVAEMIGDAGLQCAHLNYCPPETSPHDTPLLLLKRWKERYAYKATLKTLAQCLWSAGRHDLVNVCLSLSSNQFSYYEVKISPAKRGCVVGAPSQIANIAEKMVTWESVSHRLVSDAKAEEIRKNNLTDYLEQKYVII